MIHRALSSGRRGIFCIWLQSTVCSARVNSCSHTRLHYQHRRSAHQVNGLDQYDYQFGIRMGCGWHGTGHCWSPGTRTKKGKLWVYPIECCALRAAIRIELRCATQWILFYGLSAMRSFTFVPTFTLGIKLDLLDDNWRTRNAVMFGCRSTDREIPVS